MLLRLAKLLSLIVVFLTTFEMVGAAMTVHPIDSAHHASLHSKKHIDSVIESIQAEKAEETEKSEEEKNGLSRTILMDFTRIVISLSFFHTPHFPSTHLTFVFEGKPPIHALNCVFLI